MATKEMYQYRFWNIDTQYSNWVAKNVDNFYVYDVDFGRDDGLRTAHVLFGDADERDPNDCAMNAVRGREMWGLYNFAHAAYQVDGADASGLCSTVEHFLNDQGMGNKGNYRDHGSHIWKACEIMRNDNAEAYMLEKFNGINLTDHGKVVPIDYFNYALRLTALSEFIDGFQKIAEKLGYASEAGQQGLNHTQVNGLYSALWKATSTEKLLAQNADAGSSKKLYDVLLEGHNTSARYDDVINLAKMAFDAIQTIFHVDEAVNFWNQSSKQSAKPDMKYQHDMFREDEFMWIAKHDASYGGDPKSNYISQQDLLEAVDPRHHNDHLGSNDSLMYHKQTQIAGFM